MKIYKIAFLTFFILFLSACCHCDENTEILIMSQKDAGPINKNIFGTCILGWETDHGRRIKDNYHIGASYGYGVWDPKWAESVKEPTDLIKKIGIKSIRFIGQFTEWEKGVSVYSNKEYEFGLDEQMNFCKKIDAQPIICLQNIFLEDSYEKLGHYLKEKYPQVKYIEIGNETYGILSPQEYAARYLFYYEIFKKISPDFQTSVVLYNKEWNIKVLEIVKGKVDFGVVHIYPTPVWGEKVSEIPPKDIFAITLARPEIKYQPYIQETLSLLEKYAGKKVPLAVTEFNGGFAQEKPVPYRHCLGTALVNAELLRIFMKPENNILMANYWNFCNEYWGMVANGFRGNPKDLYNPYYKRPNYYIFEMYHKHFGDILIESQVACDGYEIGGKKIPYISLNTSKSSDGSKIYLMAINKNMDEGITATIDLKDFIPAGEGNAWVLNGPSVDATNEVNHDNVKVTHKKFSIAGSSFKFTFEPHSLTAIELTKKQ